MFADLLHSISNDANDAEGISELVVTALGTSGRHYICWKTQSGEYKQRSNGLPRRLQEWLFPADGSTRDFETLQVILSGEDEFWASDKCGDIRSDSTDAQKQLRRSLTFTDDALSSVTRQRLTRSRTLSMDTTTDRRRSSTLPSFSPSASPPSSKVSRVQVNHDRTPSVDKLRRLSVTPPAVQQKRRWTARPRSIGYMGLEELAVLKEIPSPQPIGAPPSNFSNPRANLPHHHCTCGCHRNGLSIQVPPVAVTRPRPAYVDACVQTEPPPEPELPEYSFQHHRVSSVTTFSSGEETESGSQRSSFETTITRPDSESLKSSWKFQPPQNPIIMGRMQDYFRSKTYILGQALHPRGMR